MRAHICVWVCLPWGSWKSEDNSWILPYQDLRCGDWTQIFRFGGKCFSPTESWPRCFFETGPFTGIKEKQWRLAAGERHNPICISLALCTIILREGLWVGGEKHKGRIPSNSPLANYFSFSALCTPFSKNKSLLRLCGFCLATKQLVHNCLELYVL